MIIDVERKRVRKIFLLERQIKAAIKEEIARLHAKVSHGRTNTHDDPTATTVLSRNTKIREVCVEIKTSTTCKTYWLKHPESWMEIVDTVYAMYEGQPIHDMMKARAKGTSPDAIADFGGIDRNTFYRWDREFLDDALVLAAERQLIHPSSYLVKEDENRL